MKHVLYVFSIAAAILFAMPAMAQEDRTYINEIEEFRRDRDDAFRNSATSPLPDEEVGDFDRLNYYPVDERFRVRAILRAADEEKAVKLNTAKGEQAEFIKYGEVDFQMNDKNYTMDVYRKGNLPELQNQPEELFMPYRDMGSGTETSTYGRYVPIDVPDNGNVTYIDFNRSFNPYSEYNSKFDSPLPPETNTFMQQSMMAGERKYEDR